MRRKYTAAPWARPSSAASPARWTSSATWTWWARARGWDTDPYTATEKDDGCLYGRGTDDDKGPVVIALYAMRCLKELGVELSHGCRLIMGTDEESGSGDLPYFYKDNAPAPNTVTPDTGFPVYNTEKGRWAPDLSAGWAKSGALPRVAALNGGFRVNVIPGDATALVLGLDADTALWAAHEAAGKYGVDLLCEPAGDGVRLSVHGTQGHAAYPDGANNALTALLGIVAALPLSPDAPANAAVRALADLFPTGPTVARAWASTRRTSSPAPSRPR